MRYQTTTKNDRGDGHRGITGRWSAPRNVSHLLGLIVVGALFAVGCGDQLESEVVADKVEPGPSSPVDNSPPPPWLFNHFDISDALIPVEKIERGGPGRDGIPAIDEPRFVPGAAVAFLQPNDLVISVTLGGKTRAYPHRILEHHEIVNDRIGTNAFCVTYCPLCGRGMVFDRGVGEEVLDFGVSGLLYQSDVLMYDRQSESLWSQLKMQAVAGKKKGSPLKQIAAEQMTFGAWLARYPKGGILSTNTGHKRRYDRGGYRFYEKQAEPIFDVGGIRDELAAKSWVIGIMVEGKAFAIPLDRIPKDRPLNLGLDGKTYEVAYDRARQEPRVMDLGSAEVPPFTMLYWFAWQAFHRNTAIVPQAGDARPRSQTN